MEILKDKKVLIGGLVVLALAGYWYWNKHKIVPAKTTVTTTSQLPIEDTAPSESHPKIQPKTY